MELMSEEEKDRAIELKDYFCILPAFRGIYSSINYAYDGVVSCDVKDAYVSSFKIIWMLQTSKISLNHIHCSMP